MRIKTLIKADTQFIFFLVYGFYACSNILLWDSNLKAIMPQVETLLKLCNYITILGLFFFIAIRLIAIDKFRLRSIQGLFIFFLVSALVLLKIKNSGFLLLVLFMTTPLLFSFSLNNLIRYDIKIKVFWLFVIIVLNKIGLIPGISGIYNQTYKQALGFHQPNSLGMFVFIILVEWLYIRFDKLSFKEFPAIFLIGLLTMKISGARTTSYMFFGVFLLFILAKINPKLFYNKITLSGFVITPPALAILSVVLTKLFINKSPFALEMNKILSDRLDYQSVYWETYGIKLFGQRIFEQDVVVNHSESSILDSAYIQCILYYGVVFAVLFVLLYSFLFYTSLKQKNVKLALMALFFVGIGFAESSMLRSFLNLTVFALLYRKHSKLAKLKTKLTTLYKYKYL